MLTMARLVLGGLALFYGLWRLAGLLERDERRRRRLARIRELKARRTAAEAPAWPLRYDAPAVRVTVEVAGPRRYPGEPIDAYVIRQRRGGGGTLPTRIDG